MRRVGSATICLASVAAVCSALAACPAIAAAHGGMPFRAGAASVSFTPPAAGKLANDLADCAAPPTIRRPPRLRLRGALRGSAGLRPLRPWRPVHGLQRQRPLGRQSARRRRGLAALLRPRRRPGRRPRDGRLERAAPGGGRGPRQRGRCSTSTCSGSAARCAADGVHLDGIYISSNHDESAPDTIGISGVNQFTSSVNAYFADYMVKRSAQAIEQAARSMQPAKLRFAEP